MFQQRRIGGGLALHAITDLLLACIVPLWIRPALAAPTTGGKPGETVYGSDVVMNAVPGPEQTMEGRKVLPGHGGFCLPVEENARSVGTRPGKVGMKPPLPGHGGFLVPGEEC